MNATFKIESLEDEVTKQCNTVMTWNNLHFTTLTNAKRILHPLPDKSTSWLFELTVQGLAHSAPRTIHCRKLKICLSHLSGETKIGHGTLSLLSISNRNNIYQTENFNFEHTSGKLFESKASYKYDPDLGCRRRATYYTYYNIHAIEIREAYFKIVCNINFTNVTHNQSKPNSAEENIGIIEYWKSMYTSKVLTDVKFAVGDVVLEGHKAVLSNRSDVFARMFQQNMLERNSNDAIEIEDCNSAVFDIFLKYLYVNEINDFKSKDWKIVLSLLQVAHKYNVKSLVDTCSDLLIKSFSIRNVLTILQVADLHQVEKLKDSAKTFVNQNFNAIGASTEWARMITSHPSIVTEFFLFMTSSKR